LGIILLCGELLRAATSGIAYAVTLRGIYGAAAACPLFTDYDPEQSAIRSLLRMMASEEATGQKATLAAAAEKIEAETAHPSWQFNNNCL